MTDYPKHYHRVNDLRKPSRFKMCAGGEWKTLRVNDTLTTFDDQVTNAVSRSFWEIHDTHANNPGGLSA